MADIVRGSMEDVENMGPQMSGVISTLEGDIGTISGIDGKTYIFSFIFCKRTDGDSGKKVFNSLKKGDNVVFNITGEGTERLVVHNVALDTSEEVTTLVPKTEAAVAGILDIATELSDDEKILNKLGSLNESLAPALKLYEEQYGKAFDNISGMLTNIEYGLAEGLKPETVDLQTIFSGLEVAKLDEEAPLFRGFLSKLMEKSPEARASGLRFFELVNTYGVQKADEIGMHKNPLKEVLFDESNISYTDWIAGIFEKFETDEAGMISLSKSIVSAEAPKISLTPRELIRKFFEEHADQIEEGDRDFLTQYYKNYPDDSIPVAKGDEVRKGDVAMRNKITPKYIIKFTEHGMTSQAEIIAARDLRDLCRKVIIQDSNKTIQS